MASVIDPTEFHARRVQLAGTFNVRDVGGYETADGRRVASRLLLRGDALHRLDEQGRALLAGYPLRTVIDLRAPGERETSPNLLGPGVVEISLPVFADSPTGSAASEIPTLGAIYERVVEDRGEVIAAVLTAIAREDALPAIVHCTGGKDRTGITIALLLSVLGVPDETVAVDYAATSLFLDEAFRSERLQQALDAGLDVDSFAGLLACEPALILEVLRRVRERSGSVEQYLLDHGLSKDDLVALRERLLEGGARDA